MSGKTHVIDGVKYVEVERKAEVGEKVIIVNDDDSFGMYENGEILIIDGKSRVDSHATCSNIKTSRGNYDGIIFDHEYRVLEPVESALTTDDLLSNLANRVASLERQLADTQRNLETWSQEFENCRGTTEPDFLDLVAEKVAAKLLQGGVCR